MTGLITGAVARGMRSYVVGFPRGRGKNVVIGAARRFLPEQAREFRVDLPGGGIVHLRWDEVIGRETLRRGVFEAAEIEAVRRYARAGSCAIDIGANVGLLTVPIALAVGAAGTVVAVEPLQENHAQLRLNLVRNAVVGRVRPYVAAAGPEDGRAVFNVANDPAFGSLGEITKRGKASDREIVVRSLDSIWRDIEQPDVSLVKIDVEGGEQAVLDGATELIGKCRPVLLVEADDDAARAALKLRLEPLGYRDDTPPAFLSNRLFVHDRH